MADKILKTVRVRERWLSLSKKWDSQNNKIVYYYNGAGFDKKVIVTKTGPNKRTVEGIFDKLEYKESEVEYGEYGEDAFIFRYLTNQAGKVKKEKVWNGTSWVEDTNYSSFPDGSINLAEWIPADGVNQFRSPQYFGQSVNETDKKYRKKFGYRPPYFEIIQDPYIEGKDSKLRSFGFDNYYLNNDCYIQINWIDKNESTVQGGDKYSDNWGRELDLSDIGEKDSGFKENDLLKRAVIYPKNDSPIVFAQEVTDTYDGYGQDYWNKVRNDVGFFYKKDLDGVKFDDKIWKGGSKKYGGGITDEDILDEILQKWQQVYNNTKLKLCDNSLEKCEIGVEYISPVMGSPSYATGGTGGTGGTASITSSTASGLDAATGATGASASGKRVRVSGSFIFDVTKKDYLINAELGELLIIEKQTIEDPFVQVFEDEITDISSEYIESEFAGDEEISEFNSWTEELEAEASSVVKDLEAGPAIDPSNASSIIPPADPNVVPGKWDLDLIPGSYRTNSQVPITLCAIGSALVNVKIAPAFLDMQAAAKKAGITLSINSAFRSPYDSINTKSTKGVSVKASSQQYLYDGWIAKKPGFNLAAKPGASNHGNGIGLDLSAGGKSSGRYINVVEKTYEWLVKNSWRYGFVRAVANEEWHFDYRPDIAAKGPYAKLPAKDTGAVTTKFYNKKKDGSYWGLDEIKIA